MAEKLPWFPLWVDKFDTDELVRPMDYEAEGIYNALLRHEWRQGSIPADWEKVAGLLKPHSASALELVKPCFPLHRSNASRRFNPRLECIREEVTRKRRKLVDAGRQGGIASGFARRSIAEASLEASVQQSPSRSSNSHSSAVEASTPQGTEEQHKTKVRFGKETWLTPYFDAWVNAYQGEPSAAELGRYIAPLRKKHGDPAVVAAWGSYLSQTEARFASPARFAKTYGTWSGTALPVTKLTAKQREEQASLEWVEQRERERTDGE